MLKTAKALSTPPAAPSKCPILPLFAVTYGLALVSANREEMAPSSAASPRGVEVA